MKFYQIESNGENFFIPEHWQIASNFLRIKNWFNMILTDVRSSMENGTALKVLAWNKRGGRFEFTNSRKFMKILENINDHTLYDHDIWTGWGERAGARLVIT